MGERSLSTMAGKKKSVLINFCILLLLCEYAAGLIIPEEVPTILSLIYSNIPPIKKGTDSRLGVGFRLGEHADFQVLVELGPQTDTDPIGSTDSKRRRDVMLSAAMRGELGPFAQAVAKYQIEQRLRKELELLKELEENLKDAKKEGSENKKTAASDWLTNWSKGVAPSSNNQIPLIADEKNPSLTLAIPTNRRRIGPDTGSNETNKISNLTKLYKLQTNETEKSLA